MSNTYNQELTDALKKGFSELDTNELQAKNIALAAKLSLYFAHGATEKAANKLSTAQIQSKNAGKQVQEAREAGEVCKNIITAATAAHTDSQNTKSNAATAAANIQIAANSLTDLSADVATILAIATSQDYGSKIQTLVDKAYQLTTTAANEAEQTTLQSLNATIEASQSRVSETLSQAQTLAAQMEALVKVLDQNFTTLQNKINADSATLAKAIANEKKADGLFSTATKEEEALLFSKKFINQHVNYELEYHEIEDKGDRFSVSFKAFERKYNQQIIKEYRILFAEKDDAAAFDIYAAKASEYYFPIYPELEKEKYTKEFVTAERLAFIKNNPSIFEGLFPTAAIDYKGQALKRGVPYVFYIYVIHTLNYQKQLNDTVGFLSLPSKEFVLQTQLPGPNKPRLIFYSNVPKPAESYMVTDAVKVFFSIPKNQLKHLDTPLLDLIDFRVILFNEKDILASFLNKLTDRESGVLFQLHEDFQRSEQAYLEAKQRYETAIATDLEDAKLLKAKLVEAENKYHKTQSNYQEELKTIGALNEIKISNFILDEDILESIPAANMLLAQAIDENYIHELQIQLKKLQETKEIKVEELNKLTEASKGLSVQPTILDTEEEIKIYDQFSNKIKKELEEHMMFIADKDAESVSFVAQNTMGDIVDNYGEPIVKGQKYNALVYTVIKPEKPEVVPLFVPVISLFSKSEEFDPIR